MGRRPPRSDLAEHSTASPAGQSRGHSELQANLAVAPTCSTDHQALPARAPLAISWKAGLAHQCGAIPETGRCPPPPQPGPVS